MDARIEWCDGLKSSDPHFPSSVDVPSDPPDASLDRGQFATGPTVRIYRPSRNVMQAGHANTKKWILEFEPQSAPWIEPLMGWTASSDVLRQVRLTFPTKEQAVAFAQRQGWRYHVSTPHD